MTPRSKNIGEEKDFFGAAAPKKAAVFFPRNPRNPRQKDFLQSNQFSFRASSAIISGYER